VATLRLHFVYDVDATLRARIRDFVHRLRDRLKVGITIDVDDVERIAEFCGGVKCQ
jgi:hypothetical protein